MPNYVMGAFLLPKGLYDEIETLLKGFWWDSEKDHSSIHWQYWDHLCAPKNQGGMGFKKLRGFNLALLGK